MPAFVWKGKTRDGKSVSGERVADNKEAVMALLRRDQILVSSVKEKGKEMALPKFGGGVPPKDLAIFVRQFSVMIDAGLPLVQCLEILGSQQENKTFAKILLQTRMDVEGGASLADAMRKHPKAFDDLFTNMIAAGEAGGILDTILKRLATYIEKAVKLKGQVKGAMVYPVAVIVIAGIVVAVILWKVIPTFAAMFEGLGAELPLPTKIVIMASNYFIRALPFLVVFTVMFSIAFRRYYATYGGHRVIDTFHCHHQLLMIRPAAHDQLTAPDRPLHPLVQSHLSPHTPAWPLGKLPLHRQNFNAAVLPPITVVPCN